MIRGKTQQPFHKLYLIYPLQAVGVFLLYGLCRLLPVRVASWLGEHLLWALGPLTSKHQTILNNLQLAWPDWSETQRRKVARDVWRNLGQVASEYPHLTRLARHIDVVGEENLRTSTGELRQALLFTAHYCNWEMNPTKLFAMGVPLSLVFREPNNPWTNWLITKIRGRSGSEAISKSAEGARQLLQAIREGRTVGMLVDQKMNDGIAVPFFGRKAMTVNAIANLTLKYKLPLIPVRIERLSRARYRMVIAAPVEIDADKDSPFDVMQRVNLIIEGWVRAHPDWWLWIHNRWPKPGSRHYEEPDTRHDKE